MLKVLMMFLLLFVVSKNDGHMAMDCSTSVIFYLILGVSIGCGKYFTLIYSSNPYMDRWESIAGNFELTTELKTQIGHRKE